MPEHEMRALDVPEVVAGDDNGMVDEPFASPPSRPSSPIVDISATRAACNAATTNREAPAFLAASSIATAPWTFAR